VVSRIVRTTHISIVGQPQPRYPPRRHSQLVAARLANIIKGVCLNLCAITN
jgi:hypothetical protein